MVGRRSTEKNDYKMSSFLYPSHVGKKKLPWNVNERLMFQNVVFSKIRWSNVKIWFCYCIYLVTLFYFNKTVLKKSSPQFVKKEKPIKDIKNVDP